LTSYINSKKYVPNFDKGINMNARKRKNFAEKHEPDATPDRRIKKEILNQTQNNELSCKVAFEIAKKLQVS